MFPLYLATQPLALQPARMWTDPGGQDAGKAAPPGCDEQGGGDQSEGMYTTCNDVNSIDCLCLLLQPDDLCNCGFVDPVATLTTAKSSPGDALVQLAECRVSLASSWLTVPLG